MTTITDWKALLTAQLECLEALSEDDIGTEVYVRNSLHEPWRGPFTLHSIVHTDVSRAPFKCREHLYPFVFATKTLPIEPQTVTWTSHVTNTPRSVAISSEIVDDC